MAASMPDSRSGDPGSKASVGRRVPAGAPEQTLPRIIIVTGTPGVGKTAVGKLLAERLGSEFLSLGDLVKTQGLHKGFDRRARSYIIDEPAVKRMLKGYLKDYREKRIVIETHSFNSILQKTHGMVAVVLRLDPLVLARRLKERNWPKLKIWENVEAELIDLSLYDSLKDIGMRLFYGIGVTGRRSGSLGSTILVRWRTSKRRRVIFCPICLQSDRP